MGWERHMGKRFWAGLVCLLLMMTTGCGITRDKAEKIRDLDYTVVKEADIPEEFLNRIETEKTTEFRMTYSDGEYLYIARGYGEQETGGYSIAVQELYLTEDAIVFSGALYGPQNGEQVTQSKSYPYIVIKLELLETPVTFI
jgi:hypothetical protein